MARRDYRTPGAVQSETIDGEEEHGWRVGKWRRAVEWVGVSVFSFSFFLVWVLVVRVVGARAVGAWHRTAEDATFDNVTHIKYGICGSETNNTER